MTDLEGLAAPSAPAADASAPAADAPGPAADSPGPAVEAPGPVGDASGPWRPEHGAGDRKFAQIGSLPLESGGQLEDVTLAYETWGQLAPDRSNAVLVLHALTGDSHVRGPAGPSHASPGWWEQLVGPGLPIDTDRFFVIAPNVLGGCQGSTGPSSPAPDGRPYGSRFPQITIRDQVAAERRLREVLRIPDWALVIGGSMGGMRALEWAATHPTEVRRLAVIASSARASADQIAWNSAQIAAIQADPWFRGGDYHENPGGRQPEDGLGIARRIAHTTYRTADELEERFSNRPQGAEDPLHGEGRHQVTSYLDHHAAKLVRRFDANTYIVLARSMSSHDVGCGRGGTAAALSRVSARTLVVSVDTDRLFPPPQVEEVARSIPAATYRMVRSRVGHDAFLLAHPELGRWIRELLDG